MWIRITGKTEEEEHRAPFCITFFLHTVHQHNQTTQSPCWIMNNKMKRKLRSSKQGRKDSSWHFKWEEVTERFTATAPDGRSYFGQTTWLGWELQLGKQKGAGRRKGTKEKKKKTMTENGIFTLQPSSFRAVQVTEQNSNSLWMFKEKETNYYWWLWI